MAVGVMSAVQHNRHRVLLVSAALLLLLIVANVRHHLPVVSAASGALAPRKTDSGSLPHSTATLRHYQTLTAQPTQARVDALNRAVEELAEAAIARIKSGPPKCLPRVCASPYNLLTHTRARRVDKVALASMPGSGNTWARSVIRAGTRLYTGSVFSDKALHSMGYLGETLEPESYKTAVVKTHYGFYRTGAPFRWSNATLHLIRAPFDAILAECSRFRGGHTGTVDPASIVAMCQEYTHRRLPRMRAAYSLWGADKNPEIAARAEHDVGVRAYSGKSKNTIVATVFYEDLIRDFARTTAYMLAFLRVVNANDDSWPDVYEGLLCALHERQTGEKVHRKAKQPPPATMFREGKSLNKYGNELCGALKSVWNERKWGPCDGHFQKERASVRTQALPFAVPQNVCGSEPATNPPHDEP